MKTKRRLCVFILSVSLTIAAGCAFFGVRTASDWSGHIDPRLTRSCRVTRYGSGVILSRTPDDIYLLTCAHVVDPTGSVSTWLIDTNTFGWIHREAKVLAYSAPDKEDLALLHVENVSGVRSAILPPLNIAEDFSEGEERDADLVAVCGIPERKPIVFPAKVFQYTVNSDAPGIVQLTQSWGGKKAPTMAKGCFHGRIGSANSGTSVFQGNKLLGLVESSPFVGIKTLGTNNVEGVQGICTSLPQTIATFLDHAGYGMLITRGGQNTKQPSNQVPEDTAHKFADPQH